MTASQSFYLKNGPVEARFSSLGAECTSLSFHGIEYLWQAFPSIWGRHAPVLFPIVGRLQDDQYIYQSKAYSLTQHGFARDREFLLLDQSQDSLLFSLKSDAKSLQVYPFAFQLEIRYTLTDTGMRVDYRVSNPSADEELWFSIGAHPGFACPLEPEKESLEDYQLDFGQEDLSSLSLYVLEKGLIGSERKPLPLKNGKLELNWELFQNDALIADAGPVTSVSIRSLKTGKGYAMDFKEFRWLGLWTKQKDAGFICIEPWNGIADTVTHNGNFQEKMGIHSLPPAGVHNVGFDLTLFQ
ncbi:aldose 1-epimerase family protein [Cyclobacterium jeungdonense]|uniref:Aldose 1-epimerase family protein n=1 Tax=Cyclobacterium jeungdonense TaxID=708087 RepID=A0ABT8CC49_9BACT|nr:aldose 1-epimerase family protein [Cyclobacterium jeungdonense]MDN3689388.1 aldose 1-epimerase family protein [Cyclobacterium jeungdonense]